MAIEGTVAHTIYVPPHVVQIVRSGNGIIVLDSHGDMWQGYFEGMVSNKALYTWTKIQGPHEEK